MRAGDDLTEFFPANMQPTAAPPPPMGAVGPAGACGQVGGQCCDGATCDLGASCFQYDCPYEDDSACNGRDYQCEPCGGQGELACEGALPGTLYK